MAFKPNVGYMFQWKWTAKLYAWRAKRKGFNASITKENGSSWELGGKYCVTLSKDKKEN